MAFQFNPNGVIALQRNAAGKLVKPILPPAAPVITAAGLTSTSNRIIEVASQGADTLRIEVATAAGGPWSLLLANLTGTFDHTSLTAGATRYYRPVAINSVGETIGDVVSATTLAGEVEPLPGEPISTGNLTGTLAHESVLTVTGVGFGAHPGNPKPLFLWRADDGFEPNLTLGTAGWGEGSNGAALTTDNPGEGMSQSAVKDYGWNNPGAILPSAPVGIGKKKIVFRRRRDNYKVHEQHAVRSRVRASSLTGEAPQEGQWVTGQTSGATGIIRKIDVELGSDRYGLYMDNSLGTVGDAANRIYFEFDEVMTWEGGSAINSEGSEQYPNGVSVGFNNKIMRFWKAGHGYTNMYIAEHENPITNSRGYMAQTVEGGDSTRYSDDDFAATTEYTTQSDFADRWVTELVVLKESSALGVADGWLKANKDGKDVFPDADQPPHLRLTLPSNRSDEPYDHVYMTQVSNGAQIGTIQQMDYLLTQDNHHWVQFRNSVTGRVFIMPCLSWVDDQIEINYQAYFNEWDVLDVVQDGDITHTFPRVA